MLWAPMCTCGIPRQGEVVFEEDEGGREGGRAGGRTGGRAGGRAGRQAGRQAGSTFDPTAWRQAGRQAGRQGALLIQLLWISRNLLDCFWSLKMIGNLFAVLSNL